VPTALGAGLAGADLAPERVVIRVLGERVDVEFHQKRAPAQHLRRDQRAARPTE
jgi:hypothetical protein